MAQATELRKIMLRIIRLIRELQTSYPELAKGDLEVLWLIRKFQKR